MTTRLHLLILLVTVVAMATSQNPADKLEPSLKSKLDKGEKVTIMISFADTAPVLERVTSSLGENASRGDRATAVNKALEEHRDKHQAGVVKLLSDKGIEFKQFWINNRMAVQNAGLDIALAIAADPEVVRITEEQVAYLMDNSGGATPATISTQM